MTTVTIGKNNGQKETNVQPIQKDEQNQSVLSVPENEKVSEKPYVKYFSSPVPAKRHIQLRGVFIVQLLLCAAAGAFIWLSVIFGSDDFRGAVTETVQGVLNG